MHSRQIYAMDTHYEQLTSEERASIIIMANNCSACKIVLSLCRKTSTITRELALFAAWQDWPASMANATAAHDARASGLRAWRARFKCRKRAKLATDNVLFVVVQYFLVQGWSHSQIVGTITLMWPEEPQRNVFHDSIFTYISATPHSELHKGLIAIFAAPRPSVRREARAGIAGARCPFGSVSMCRAPEASDWQYPGNCDCDLIKDTGRRSVLGVVAESRSRLVMLIKPAYAAAASAQEGLAVKLRSIAESMPKTLTCEQGKDMERHADLCANTGVMVYFCHPHSPWQRSSCENPAQQPPTRHPWLQYTLRRVPRASALGLHTS